jgi:zinc protease
MIRNAYHSRPAVVGPEAIPSIGTPRTAVIRSFVDTVLPNGLRVLLVRHPVPRVQLRLGIPFAGPDPRDGPRHTARAAPLARTVFAGTSRRDRLAVACDMAGVGGGVTAMVTPERLGIGGEAVARGLATLLDVVIDAVTDAAYPDDEVMRERDQLIQDVALRRTYPVVLSRDSLHRHRHGDHPVAREVPHPDDVAALTPDEIRGLHLEAVVPRGAALVLVGDLDLDQALAEVERVTERWTSPSSAPRLPPLPAPVSGGLRVVDLPGAQKSHLRFAAPALAYTDPRQATLSLVSRALAGGPHARLFDVVRDQNKYCETVSSVLETVQDTSGVTCALTVSMVSATETTAAAVLALHTELDRLAAEPPGPVELHRYRQDVINWSLTAAVSQAGLTDVVTMLAFNDLGVDLLALERERLDTVTVDDLAEAARELLTPPRLTGVILGDANQLRNTLSGVDGVRMPEDNDPAADNGKGGAQR